LRLELDQALAREEKAAIAVEKERQAARGTIAELEGVVERSEREHRLLRERMEARLEHLRLAMEEEERENGSQVRSANSACPFHGDGGPSDNETCKVHPADNGWHCGRHRRPVSL